MQLNIFAISKSTMKHSYLFALFALLLIPCMAFADSVTQEQALAKAVQFFMSGKGTRTTPRLEMVFDGETTTTRATTQPAFYVFNRTDASGFVIIAGDDVAAPLIGYSHQNNFDANDIPDNLRWWLDEIRATINDARDKGLAPYYDQNIVNSSTEIVLQTATWGQGTPYKNDCPLLNGTRCITGCVQTAAAIICKYFKWPTDISGTVPAYTTSTEGIKVPERTLSGYNFDLMPNSYKSGYTTAQAAEVARLMADLGSMTQANYGTSATGASTSKIPTSLATYMRYNKGSRYLTKISFSDSEWITMLKAEIDANHPCIYKGNNITSGGGHAWVMDGYNSNGLIHFNWGWNGSSNGFFNISPTASDKHNYANNQACAFDMIPDRDGTSNYTDLVMTSSTSNGAVKGLSTTATSFKQGDTFKASFCAFNYGNTLYTGKIRLEHFSKNGEMKGAVSKEYSWTDVKINSGYSYNNSVACTITEPIRSGDYIAGVFWERNKQRWEIIRNRTDVPSRIILMENLQISYEALRTTTSMEFDRATRALKFTCDYPDVTFTLLNSTGSKIASQTYQETPITFDCSKLATGKYTVQVSHQEISTPITFTIVF